MAEKDRTATDERLFHKHMILVMEKHTSISKTMAPKEETATKKAASFKDAQDKVTAELRRMKEQRGRRLSDAVTAAVSALEGRIMPDVSSRSEGGLDREDDLEEGGGEMGSTQRRMANLGTSVLESAMLSALLKELDEKEPENEGGKKKRRALRYKRRPLYSRPLQRQKWGDDVAAQHSEWGDLFYDLFYVAAAYNLGNLLTSALDPNYFKKGIVYFVAIFGSLYIAWEESVLYQSRYATGDYYHQFVNLLRLLFVSLSVIHIDPVRYTFILAHST